MANLSCSINTYQNTTLMKILVVTYFSILSFVSYSQDPSFSQPSNNLTYFNPAFTGTSENLRVGITYRNEWPNIPKNYSTTSVYVDQYLGKYGGLGITYVRDVSGDIYFDNSLNLTYAYKFKVGETGVLSTGLEVGYFQNRADWSKFTYNYFVYNPVPIQYKDVVKSVDVGAGILYYNKNFFASYSVHHLNKPNVSFTEEEHSLPVSHNVFIGSNINIGNILLIPQISFSRQDTFSRVSLLLKTKYKWLLLTTGYVNKSAIIAGVGADIKAVRLSYSYDFSISKLSMSTGGNHEISLQFFLNTIKKKNERAFILY